MRVTIKGDCRTFTTADQTKIEQRIRALVKGICDAHGATALVDYHNEFIPLMNTAREVSIASSAARSVVGAELVDDDCALITASEDFAQFLQVVPGCYLDIGNGITGSCGSSLHNNTYDFNDEILTIGASFYRQVVASELGPLSA